MAKKTKPSESVEASAPAGTPRMLEHYLSTVRPALGKALDRTNLHAIPRLEKIVVNMGVGVAVSEKKYLEEAIGAMTQVTGQKPIATLSKAAVSGFKLRENLPIGCKVTLRGRRMYEFLDRLVSLALPRVAISVACRARPSTAMGTTASDCPNRWFSRRSIRTSTHVRRA